MDVSALVPPLVQYLKHQRQIVDYTYVAAVALFIYDYLLTVHLEIRLIWPSAWNYTKVLFLMIRYMAFANSFIIIFIQTPTGLSLDTCRRVFPVPSWTIPLHLFLAEVVLSIRTWAVWRKNKFIGAGLGLMTITHLTVVCVLSYKFSSSMQFATAPYPGFRGCFITAATPIIWGLFATNAAAEAIVLCLMAISAFRLYKQGSSGELAHVIHRDGVLFYFYLLIINITNVSFIATVPHDLMVALSPLEDCLYTILTCRIVLTIRGVNNRTMDTELHTAVYEPPPSGIRFRNIARATSEDSRPIARANPDDEDSRPIYNQGDP